MNLEQLKRGNELVEIIKATEKGISQIEVLISKQRDWKEKDRYYDDGSYSLSISEHSDGSGINAKLYRYQGNTELTEIILKTLEKQLEGFNKELESL